jgi:Cft2 family RNA processing exonuclease
MGLLSKAVNIRRLKMKVFIIDNPLYFDKNQINYVVAKGQKVIVLPHDGREVVLTGGHLPHIKKIEGLVKYCHKCKKWLLLRMFNKNKYSKDGLKDVCNVCDNERRRIRYAKTKAVT